MSAWLCSCSASGWGQPFAIASRSGMIFVVIRLVAPAKAGAPWVFSSMRNAVPAGNANDRLDRASRGGDAMEDEQKTVLDRRTFLKTAAASVGVGAAGTVLAQSTPAA